MRCGRSRGPAARPEDLEIIDAGALNVAGGQKAGAEIAALPTGARPTAVFCANDLIALGVLQEMTRNRIRVPEDISIIGYDDIDFAAAAAVPLTSVRQPRHQIGRTAARLLLDEAAGDRPTSTARSSSSQSCRAPVHPSRIVRRDSDIGAERYAVLAVITAFA